MGGSASPACRRWRRRHRPTAVHSLPAASPGSSWRRARRRRRCSIPRSPRTPHPPGRRDRQAAGQAPDERRGCLKEVVCYAADDDELRHQQEHRDHNELVVAGDGEDCRLQRAPHNAEIADPPESAPRRQRRLQRQRECAASEGSAEARRCRRRSFCASLVAGRQLAGGGRPRQLDEQTQGHDREPKADQGFLQPERPGDETGLRLVDRHAMSGGGDADPGQQTEKGGGHSYAASQRSAKAIRGGSSPTRTPRATCRPERSASEIVR